MPEVVEEIQIIAEPSLADLKAIASGTLPAAVIEPKPKPATPETPAEAPPLSEAEKPPAGSESTEAAQGTVPETQKIEPGTPSETTRKQSGLEKRFSKLTRERDEANARAGQLAKDLEAAKQTSTAKPPAVETAAGEPTPPNRATWTGTWEELEDAKDKYARDIASYIADQTREQIKVELRREHEASETQTHAQALQDSWIERRDKVLFKKPEFQEAIETIGLPLSQLGMSDLVMESEVGLELVQELYDKPEDMARVMKQRNPLAVARELGKIEARIIAAAKAPEKPVVVPAKPLPKPPATPGGGGVAAEPSLEDLPIGEFKKRIPGLLRH